jgi:hypothetical protein
MTVKTKTQLVLKEREKKSMLGQRKKEIGYGG